ncbi:MAG: response regulator [Planctomycetes bacterium]|nr:response regulator [Planctomycetota bacterium]
MTVILVSNDLMAASNIRGAAQALQITLTVTGNIDAVLSQCNEGSVDLVILDLSTPGLDPEAVLPRLRSAERPPGAVVAFGPHVHQQRLEKATEAGCDEVLTRGQMHAQAEAVLSRYAGGR